MRINNGWVMFTVLACFLIGMLFGGYVYRTLGGKAVTQYVQDTIDVYVIHGTVNAPNGLTIRGEGRKNTIFYFDPGVGPPGKFEPLFEQFGIDSVHFEHSEMSGRDQGPARIDSSQMNGVGNVHYMGGKKVGRWRRVNPKDTIW